MIGSGSGTNATGPSCDHRYPYPALVQISFVASQPSIAVEVIGVATAFHVGTVVGCEDDDRILIQSKCVHLFHHLTDHIIEERYHRSKCGVGFLLRGIWALTEPFTIVNAGKNFFRKELPAKPVHIFFR